MQSEWTGETEGVAPPSIRLALVKALVKGLQRNSRIGKGGKRADDDTDHQPDTPQCVGDQRKRVVAKGNE